jgi:hypothetical protein
VFLLSPKSCATPWSESRDQGLDLEVLTCGLLFIPSYPGLTSARPLWDLPQVNYLLCVVLGFGVGGQFLASLEEFC